VIRDYDWTDRAIRDLAAAREWYDRRDVDLGNQFVDDVLKAIRIARERPGSCPLIRPNVRGVRCGRFPYRIYFEIIDERVFVLAIYHTARRPDRWDDPDRE
jgi:plasmid stabilization system protein ParE